MLDPVTIIVGERALERMTLVIFAGISLILGYRLFRAGITDRQRGEMSWGTLKVKLLDVGPGVFFALFGTVVFGILSFRTVDLTDPNALLSKSDHRAATVSDAPHITYETENKNLSFDSITDDDARAITTMLDLLESRKLSPPLEKAQLDAFERSKKGLRILRKSAAYQKFPQVAKSYEAWTTRTSVDPNFVNSLSKEGRDQFEAMTAFLNDSYLTGGQQ